MLILTFSLWTVTRRLKQEIRGLQIRELLEHQTSTQQSLLDINVLRLVDSDDQPAMGFIYHEMDMAKEKIQINFNFVKKSYEPILKIIDDRWELQLHRPLHVAGYYLNPHFHYVPDFKDTYEVKVGLYNCLERMVVDANESAKIDVQFSIFRHAKGFFGRGSVVKGRKIKEPAEWWDSFGGECPELQNFAIRKLSLTCSSSGCERNWSAFEMVHTNKRNHLHQKKMNDLVFVMCNLKLKDSSRKNVKVISYDDLSSDDEWVVEEENEVDHDNELLDVLDKEPIQEDALDERVVVVKEIESQGSKTNVDDAVRDDLDLDASIGAASDGDRDDLSDDEDSTDNNGCDLDDVATDDLI